MDRYLESFNAFKQEYLSTKNLDYEPSSEDLYLQYALNKFLWQDVLDDNQKSFVNKIMADGMSFYNISHLVIPASNNRHLALICDMYCEKSEPKQYNTFQEQWIKQKTAEQSQVDGEVEGRRDYNNETLINLIAEKSFNYPKKLNFFKALQVYNFLIVILGGLCIKSQSKLLDNNEYICESNFLSSIINYTQPKDKIINIFNANSSIFKKIIAGKWNLFKAVNIDEFFKKDMIDLYLELKAVWMTDVQVVNTIYQGLKSYNQLINSIIINPDNEKLSQETLDKYNIFEGQMEKIDKYFNKNKQSIFKKYQINNLDYQIIKETTTINWMLAELTRLESSNQIQSSRHFELMAESIDRADNYFYFRPIYNDINKNQNSFYDCASRIIAQKEAEVIRADFSMAILKEASKKTSRKI